MLEVQRLLVDFLESRPQRPDLLLHLVVAALNAARAGAGANWRIEQHCLLWPRVSHHRGNFLDGILLIAQDDDPIPACKLQALNDHCQGVVVGALVNHGGERRPALHIQAIEHSLHLVGFLGPGQEEVVHTPLSVACDTGRCKSLVVVVRRLAAHAVLAPRPKRQVRDVVTIDFLLGHLRR